MEPKATTHIVFVLDRSGSMQSLQTEAAQGFNEFIAAQRKLPGSARITLIQFSTENQTSCTKAKLKDAPVLVPGTNYNTSGMTALLDALGRAITEHEDEKKVIVAVLTDGQENASHEHTKKGILELIERKTKDGWQFHYLSSDANAFHDAGSLGIAATNTVQMSADAAGMQHAYTDMSGRTSSYRSS
jgi:Mg-chelatase subunit ChlD